jgi:D-citramalate synthase
LKRTFKNWTKTKSRRFKISHPTNHRIRRKKETVTKKTYLTSYLTFGQSNLSGKIIVESYVLSHAKGLRPSTTLCLKIDGEVIEEHAQGEQFDAFMNALEKYIPQKLACHS